MTPKLKINGNYGVKPSILDKTIGYFSPKYLKKRLLDKYKANLLSNGPTFYSGSWENASVTNRNLADFLPPFLDPNQEYDEISKRNLQSRAKYADNNFGIARSCVDTNVTNVIGGGLRLQSVIKHEFLDITEEEAYKKQQEIEFKFNCWAEDALECSMRGDLNFYQLQAQLSRMSFIVGDSFCNTFFFKRPNGVFNLKLQGIAAQRVRNKDNVKNTPNKLVDGCEYDSEGKIAWYHVANRYQTDFYDFSQNTKWKRVPVYGENTGLRRFMHINNIRILDQARGEPYIANTLQEILQLHAYIKSESLANLIQSYFTMVIESEDGTTTLDELDMAPQLSNTPTQVEQDVSTKRKELQMAPGAILQLAEGEKATFANPSRPNPQFDKFLTGLSSWIGAATGLPAELILKRFQSSYTAARGALIEAWKHFLVIRSNFAYQYCKPVYMLWLYDAVLSGIIELPGFLEDPFKRKAWAGSSWEGYRLQNVQELQQANSSAVRIQNSISTKTQEAALLGNDIDTIARQKKYEEWLGLTQAPVTTLIPGNTIQTEDEEESNQDEEGTEDNE